ncbi:substrate-binding periplasmic protein [Chitinimonas lacunae]|uniref:Substrate-binding periplasmic protein n=1 Tax=Chitinimonas lacunae TaxID=1963018 RepID=A0ABV8MV12_9NEIS
MQQVLILVALAVSTASCELSLAFNDEPLLPYLAGSGPEILPQQPGIAVEMVQRVAADLGCTIRYYRMPNRRVLAETQSGRYDGAFMYSYNAERAVHLAYPEIDGHPDPSRRMTSLSYYAYRRQGSEVNWDGKRFSQLNGSVGVNLGWSVGNDLRNLGIPIEEALSTKQNFDKLRAGRIGAYATQDLAGDSALRNLGYKDIERLPLPISTKDYYLVFNRDFYHRNRPIVERFWKRLGAVRDEVLRQTAPRYTE